MILDGKAREAKVFFIWIELWTQENKLINIMKGAEKMSIEEYWEEIDKPAYLFDSSEIEKFLKEFISRTGGNINIDSIHDNGFSDEIVKIEREGSVFQFYWKDFKEIYDKDRDGTATEDELTNVVTFGKRTYIYYLIDIHKLEIIKSSKNGIFVIVHSKYLTKKEAKNFLNNRYHVLNSEVTNDVTPTRKVIVFIENQRYVHECRVDVLPISNIVLFQKKAPWDCDFSHYLLGRSTLVELIEPIFMNSQKVNDLAETDEEKIRSLINDIRYSLEGLLKFYFILQTIAESTNFDENDHYDKIINSIMDKYGNIVIGELNRHLKKEGISISTQLVRDLNTYSHYSGYFPNKTILSNCYKEYFQLVDEMFDLEKYSLEMIKP